jgi:hypothetical protein
MERIIVTVKRHKEARVRDLEVPAGVEVAQLAELIAAALHWDRDSGGGAVSYLIEAEPPGRVLQPEETLIKAGVKDGAWLTFIPHADETELAAAPPVVQKPLTPPAPVDTEAPAPKGPVVKWESLFPDGAPEPEGELPEVDRSSAEGPSEDEPPESPFIWKEIDL